MHVQCRPITVPGPEPVSQHRHQASLRGGLEVPAIEGDVLYKTAENRNAHHGSVTNHASVGENVRAVHEGGRKLPSGGLGIKVRVAIESVVAREGQRWTTAGGCRE